MCRFQRNSCNQKLPKDQKNSAKTIEKKIELFQIFVLFFVWPSFRRSFCQFGLHYDYKICLTDNSESDPFIIPRKLREINHSSFPEIDRGFQKDFFSFSIFFKWGGTWDWMANSSLSYFWHWYPIATERLKNMIPLLIWLPSFEVPKNTHKTLIIVLSYLFKFCQNDKTSKTLVYDVSQSKYTVK